jgi:hypothetical protein
MTNKKALGPGDLRAVSLVAFRENPSAADYRRIMLIMARIAVIRDIVAMESRCDILDGSSR